MKIKSFVLIFVIGIIFRINVGEYANVKYPGFEKELMYCGMVDIKIFSIRSSSGKSAINLYFPTYIKQINYHGVNLKIISVTPTELTLEKVEN